MNGTMKLNPGLHFYFGARESIFLFSFFLILSCSTATDIEPSNDDVSPELHSLNFLAVNNPLQLVDDVSSTINDSIVECWIPTIVKDKELIPTLQYTGDLICFDGIPYTEGACDFSKPLKLTITKSDIRKDYYVYVYSYTGIPVLWIDTYNRKDTLFQITKEDYTDAHLILEENVLTRSAGEVVEADCKIKGRGNSSWVSSPKKSYRLQFDKKISLLGDPKDKSYVLIANYFDKTMLRNKTAYYMGEISKLDYTPKFHYVELFLNGRYDGTYLLGDKLKIDKNRVDVGDDGFLLEVDLRVIPDEDVYFNTEKLSSPVSIKDPDVEAYDENFCFIRDFVNNAEKVLFSDNFRSVDDGWQKYMDITSFVDWYIINEITRNGDAIFLTSVYMNYSRGGKLKMGPLWDFDVAMGNNYTDTVYPTEGFYIKNAAWYKRLFEDPVFVNAVKERFLYFYSHKNDIFSWINSESQYIRRSVLENDKRWGTLYTYTFPNHDIWGSYLNEVQSLKLWLNQRFEWLKTEFENM